MSCCTLCQLYLSIRHSSKCIIVHHADTELHKHNISAASSVQHINKYFKKDSSEKDELAAAKLVSANKAVMHHHFSYLWIVFLT